MFWADWGSPAKIEKASMDGSNRRVLHNTGLLWPNDVTLDYATRRVYWVDAFLDRIEHSFYDGSDRVTLISGLSHPFALTIQGDLIYWTDWTENTVQVAHKQLSLGVSIFREFLRERPFGIAAVTPDRQANVTDPCPSSGCSHLCLLSSNTSSGFKCLCPRGFVLLGNGVDCRDLMTIRPAPMLGSCLLAGYTSCCSSSLASQFCAGSEPHNCYCDRECVERDDCCPDIGSTCPMNGSCANAGYQACCSLRHSSNVCRGDDNVCMCDRFCTFYGDCCSDYGDVCPPGEEGSCVAANYISCCTSGECFGAEIRNCKCDSACRVRGDCCSDIDFTCGFGPPPTVTTVMPTMMITTPMVTPEQTTPPPTTPPQTTAEQATPPPTTPPPTTAEQTTPPPTTPPRTTAEQTTPAATTEQTKPPSTTTETSTMPIGSISDLRVSVSSEQQIAVSWRGLEGINMYTLQVANYSGDIAASRIVDGSFSTDGVNYAVQIISGIGPYIPYNVTVFGSNEFGRGIPISEYYIFTAETVPPVAPTVNKPVRESDSVIKVTWTKLTPDIALGLVTNYTISYRIATSITKRQADSSASGGLVVVGPDVNLTRIDKLDGSADYVIIMWANTSRGKGKESVPFTVEALAISGPRAGGSAGAVAGGILGTIFVLVVVVLVVLAVLWLIRKHNKAKNTDYSLFGEQKENQVEAEEDDKAKIIATSFKQTGNATITIAENPMTTFDNPIYGVTKGAGLPSTSSSNTEFGSDPESEMLKEDLAMIGRPIMQEEDDINL